MLVITQAFAGHLGDLELAVTSITNNVIVGFEFGLLLGMASALETLFLCCVLLWPIYLFASLVLKVLGQPKEVAEFSGIVFIWMIPLHFSFAFQFPLQKFLQSQLKNTVIAWVSLVASLVHVMVSWLFMYRLELGVIGAAMTLNFYWWVLVFWPFGLHLVVLLLGKASPLNTHFNDWALEECRDCSGFIFLGFYKMIVFVNGFRPSRNRQFSWFGFGLINIIVVMLLSNSHLELEKVAT